MNCIKDITAKKDTNMPLLLKDKDRIIFLGDSITQAGVLDGGYISLSAHAITKQYPKLAIELIGAGINGHRVNHCQKRLDRDVLQKKPSTVFIYIGVNDVWHWQHERGTTADEFKAGLEDITTRILKSGAKIILCTPSVIGERVDGSNKYDHMLDDYADISRNLACQNGVELLDLRAEFMTYLKAHNPHNMAQGILTKDGVHLNKQGNIFLSSLVLEAFNVFRMVNHD